MSDLEPIPDGVELQRGEADLDTAAGQLRAQEHPRRVEIADRVLTRALAAPRRSHLVRAHSPHDHVHVSTLAITAALREHLDHNLVGAAVGRILIDVDRDGQLTALTVELYVQYGTEILPTGDLTRDLAREVLTSLLGQHPAGDDLPVMLSHVHVSDITIGDPHIVDPADERNTPR
jgi:hypothetical protein